MDALSLLILVGVGGVFALVAAVALKAQWAEEAKRAPVRAVMEEALDQLVSELGGEDRHRQDSSFCFSIDGVKVTCCLRTAVHEEEEDTIEVRLVDSAPWPIPPGLTIESRGYARHSFSASDQLSCADEFDERVRVRGQRVEMAALLGARVRSTILDLMRSGTLRVSMAGVYWSLETSRVKTPNDLLPEIRQAIDLARLLRLQPDTIPRRLAENAVHDPVPAVCLRNLRLLLDSYPETDHARHAAEALLGAEAPDVRLRTARFLGTGDAITTLISLLQEAGVGDETRGEALEALAPALSEGALVPLLHEIFVAQPPVHALRLAAIRTIGSREVKGLVTDLLEAAPGADDETMAALAGALGALGDPTAEPALLPRLGTEVKETRLAVVRALGRVGTATAVAHLLPFTTGLRDAAGLKSAARESIEEIQERLSGAEEGQLSIAGTRGEEGTLSLRVEEGDLSLAESPSPPPVAAEASGET